MMRLERPSVGIAIFRSASSSIVARRPGLEYDSVMMVVKPLQDSPKVIT